MTPAKLPTDELTALGQRLQQSIVLTRIRIAKCASARIRARGDKVLANADKLFTHLSQLIQAASGIQQFMKNAFGISVADIFEVTGKPRLAHGVVYTATAAINEMVKLSIDDIAAINQMLEKEETRNAQTKKDSAAV